jgi:hypothetical protein
MGNRANHNSKIAEPGGDVRPGQQRHEELSRAARRRRPGTGRGRPETGLCGRGGSVSIDV